MSTGELRVWLIWLSMRRPRTIEDVSNESVPQHMEHFQGLLSSFDFSPVS